MALTDPGYEVPLVSGDAAMAIATQMCRATAGEAFAPLEVRLQRAKPGNHARYRQRIGTETNLAYLTSAGVDDVYTSDSKAFVSTLGEMDLGLGYRVTNAWSIRGGYRLLSACGVATAPGSIATDYSTLAASSRVRADDCIILHGGYVGIDFNW